jgi:hypothetical protein
LGAKITKLAVNDAIEMLPFSKTWGAVRQRFDEISNTLRRELESTTVICLSSWEQEYFAPNNLLFGLEFQGNSKMEASLSWTRLRNAFY